MALWRNDTREGLPRVKKRLVGRDSSCGFPYSRNLCSEPLYERNRFVCLSVVEKVRTAVNANLWGIRNGYVILRALSL